MVKKTKALLKNLKDGDFLLLLLLFWLIETRLTLVLSFFATLAAHAKHGLVVINVEPVALCLWKVDIQLIVVCLPASGGPTLVAREWCPRLFGRVLGRELVFRHAQLL
jgi:hypothetical protein